MSRELRARRQARTVLVVLAIVAIAVAFIRFGGVA